MFCSQCGAKNNDTDRFCSSCGSPLAKAGPAPAQAKASPPPPPVYHAPAPPPQVPPAYTPPPPPYQQAAPPPLPPQYQAPPDYQQQYYGQQGQFGQPGAAVADEGSRKLYAVLAYFFGFLGGIVVLLTQKGDNLLRFHAWQSIITNIVIGALYIVLGILNTIVAIITGNALLSLVMGLLGLATFIIYVVLLVKAYQLQWFKLPVIGSFAEKQANKPS